MRFLSLFSGIEAATVAWGAIGWEPVAFSEVEGFPNAVLEHHYPEVPNLGDITQITEADVAALGPIDIVVFGSPCQDLSVAGQREGLNGERSHLFFRAADIVRWAQRHGGCRWALWENVPGALSSRKGADFGAVVGTLAGAGALDTPKDGWGKEGAAVGEAGMVEWSVLDAQWFGVAQRRRRVFALADFGDWADRPPILLEPESLRGDSPPSREPGERAAPTISARTKGGGGLGTDTEVDGGLIPQGVALRGREGGGTAELTGQVQPAIRCGAGGGDKPHALIPFDTTQVTSKWNYSRPQPGQPCHPLAAGAHPPAVAGPMGFNARQGPQVTCIQTTQDLSPALTAPDRNAAPVAGKRQDGSRLDRIPAVCITGQITHALNTANNGKHSSEDGTGRGVPTVAYGLQTDATPKASEEVSFTLKLPSSGGGGGQPAAVQYGMAVRRLVPEECEALQGFPRGHTAIPWRGKPADQCPDGPRYKALGNSMAVPVVRWIGERIEAVAEILCEEEVLEAADG